MRDRDRVVGGRDAHDVIRASRDLAHCRDALRRARPCPGELFARA
jgi:hypothetical protein